jgi:hypothetical protein
MSEARKQETRGVQQAESTPSWLACVREQVASLKFGTVLITIHDSRVVQVEKNEKLRLDSPGS